MNNNITSDKITKTQITTAAKAAVVQSEQRADSPEQRARVKRVIMGVDMHKRDCKVTTLLGGSAAQPAQTIPTEGMVGWLCPPSVGAAGFAPAARLLSLFAVRLIEYINNEYVI